MTAPKTELELKQAALLEEAKAALKLLQAEVETLTREPLTTVTFCRWLDKEHKTAEVFDNGRKKWVGAMPELEIKPGQEAVVNPLSVMIAAAGYTKHGHLVTVAEVLDDGRVLLDSGTDEETLAFPAQLTDLTVKAGDTVLYDARSGYIYEVVTKAEVQELLLEEAPDVSFEDIGGLGSQIEAIRDAVELPFLHKELFTRMELRPPKGVLLYGAPGCGKTMIAKAIANRLAQQLQGKDAKAHFISIKGPELLNKYVGETERHIRLIFQKARESASSGTPVIIFFDEMESLFRIRGSGISSDVENSIVPQLLAEMDGVEGLENVIVIGASNREDMIDPAILRPGRLDVKIKVDRPDREGAAEIFGKYLTDTVPLEDDASKLITEAVSVMYAETKETQFLEVTYESGETKTMYFKDFSSGAMIQNIVDRAKKYAIKSHLDGGKLVITSAHLAGAVAAEYLENEDLPNTTNPDDWAKISGQKGERIKYIRTLVHDKKGGTKMGRAIETSPTGAPGQYL